MGFGLSGKDWTDWSRHGWGMDGFRVLVIVQLVGLVPIGTGWSYSVGLGRQDWIDFNNDWCNMNRARVMVQDWADRSGFLGTSMDGA